MYLTLAKFRVIIINENTKHFREVNILKQTFTVYFSKKTSSARLDLRVIFDNYDEMSDSVREAFADGEAENEVKKITLWHTQHYYFNYLYLLGNLIDSENPFEYFKDLFVSTSETNSRFFAYQLANAEKDYTEYIQHNNFSKDFFDIYANSKRITLNRKLFEVVNKHFVPLRIDSKTDDIFYSYESTDIKDIIFSSIHFALENGYKFSQCSHCGRWFFKDGSRAGSRKKYCNRKSTFNGYEHLPCEQAVRNINQELQREKKRIYNSMVREHLSTEQFVYDFLDECAEYMTKIKKCASVQNLSDYWTFLKKYKDGVKNGNNK